MSASFSKSSNQAEPKKVQEFEEKVLEIRRVSKKTKGGNKVTFSALVIVGNKKGRAGVGFGKAPDVISAIRKGVRLAKRDLVDLEIVKGTINHEILHKRGAAKVLLKPAPEGTGVIAGGAVRAVVEAFGIKNIVSKRMGTTNKPSNVYAAFEALTLLKAVGSGFFKAKKIVVPNTVTKEASPIKEVTKNPAKTVN